MMIMMLLLLWMVPVVVVVVVVHEEHFLIGLGAVIPRVQYRGMFHMLFELQILVQYRTPPPYHKHIHPSAS